MLRVATRHLTAVSSLRRCLLSTSSFSMAPQRVEIGEISLENGKMTEVPFPDKDSEQKILLSKIEGKYYATSSKCTHYGAPLAKGVLTCSGRVVCPWHGAAFNVCTGDIEDAPGLNNLRSYKVEQEGSKLFVTAPDDKPTEATREPPSVQAKSEGKGVVIIGGGAGAAHAIESLREEGYEGRIRVVSAEEYLPIDRTKLSKALITDASKIAIRPKEFYEKLSAEFTLGQEADKIDFENAVVSLKNGDKLEYENLVIATGSTPNKIPVKGSDLGNIFLMRGVSDAQDIVSALGSEEEAKGKKVVVIGSSFIGMEVASAINGKGASVTVVGMDNVPFEAILGKTVGAGMQKQHEGKGTKFLLPASLDSLEESKTNAGKVGAVKLKDGQSIEADLVVMGVGVKPATQVLKNSGVELEKDGSVKTDEFLRIGGKGLVTGNVFAIGDIASYKDVKTGENVRVEHWNVASNHARAVAATIMQKGSAFEKVSVFWSAQPGGQLRYAGNSRSKQWKEDIVQGDPAAGKFVAYYALEDEVVAVATMGNDPLAAHVSELMRLGKMIGVKDIKDGKSPLEVELK